VELQNADRVPVIIASDDGFNQTRYWRSIIVVSDVHLFFPRIAGTHIR
jgi:hypothetical protein